MRYSSPQRNSGGMTRGQMAVLAVLAVLTFGVVIGGGYYVISDSGLLGGSENEPVAQFASTPTATTAVESLPEPSSTPESGAKLPPAWTSTPSGLYDIDFVQWAIQLSDLPSGFANEPLEESHSETGFVGENGEGEMVNSFFFTRAGEDAQFLLGITGLVLDHEQDEFNTQISREDFLVEEFVDPFDHNGILEQEEMSDLDNLGDIAVGHRYLLDMEGVELRINLIAFRRDIAGVFLVMGYVDGYPEAVPIRDLAYLLDQRILSTLPDTP
jgi:hypothetical protein